MDEPTTALNEAETDHLFDTIKRLRGKGISVIYISHRMEEIFEVGDRASVIRDGSLIGTVDIDKTSSEKLIAMMVGRTIKEKFYKEKTRIGDFFWKGENLTNETRSINGVNFYIRCGEILGLAGLRGSGFKEFARMLGGVEPLTQGFLVNSKGEKKQPKNPSEAISEGIGYLPDDRKGEGLVIMQTVRNNVVLPIIHRLSRKGWVDDKRINDISRDYVKRLNIQTPGIDSSVEFLSGGNQQKVVLSKWLLTQPSLLLLDEPTRGIDVGAKREIYAFMSEFAKAGNAIIMISSELPEIMQMSDRIAVFREGRVVAIKNRTQFSQDSLMSLASYDLGEE